MKVARVMDENGQQFNVGLADSGEWLVLAGDPLMGSSKLTDKVIVPHKWLPPLIPPAIFCIGLNYAKHILESNMPTPKEPVIFMKNPASVVGHDGFVQIPKVCDDELDYEGELAVVIGKPCRDVGRDDAYSVVFGYTVANDISARIWQLQRGGSQWVRGKSFDTFAPLGPCIVTSDELQNPNRLSIKTTLNGRVVQHSNTADMLFDVPALISFCSQDTTLFPGTVIMTGTPEGIGWSRTPRITLRPDDEVQVDIQGIGSLRNHISRASPEGF